ncbi:hypothetical protein [Actinoplanes sp. NPDC049599]|uniref:hypothetical protein n=1 Tax=Actinoplanes sp. NPDC049599 TaxID=3363903 RepID=UPI003795D95F
MPRPVACNPGWGCEEGNGGLLSLGDDEDDVNGTPYRPRVQTSETATPVASELPTEPDPSESSEPEDTGTPTPTADAEEAACVTRSERSAAMVHFDEDYSNICSYVPDYDFGVSAKNYDRCVKRSRTYHVKRYMYESTCRYDHTYKWTETDDPDHAYTPDVPDNNYDSNRSYTPNIPDRDYSPAVPDYDYDPDLGETDNGSGTPSDGLDVNDDPHSGCTWVNSYHRKDGTYVRGHYRC